VRVRAVTEKRAEGERLRLAQLTLRQGGSTQLFEATPATITGVSARKEKHLLPLPAGVASLARRWEESGGLSCEILGPAAAKECFQTWTAAGWTTDQLSGAEGTLPLVVLRKDGRVIQLCPVEAGLSGSLAYLLLLAMPAEQ
jgi:hypothetical protein